MTKYNRVRMRILAIILLYSVFIVPLSLEADSVWEGSATASRYNEFPDTGFYGASNSFPRNTTVTVENLENGRKIRLIITGRVSDPELFILVSKEAAASLGMPHGEIVRTRVVIAKESAADNYIRNSDYLVNPDPDVNLAMIAKKHSRRKRLRKKFSRKRR